MSRFENDTAFTRLSIINSHLSRTVPKADEYRLVHCDRDEPNAEMVDLHIISREIIKPASSTPHHLRTFKLSIIDQYMVHLYTPMILFLSNTDNTCANNILKVRSRRLKESLSELLTSYYPFAGEMKDNLHIECNDKGVVFVEARVNQTLEEFLRKPDDRKLRELTPKHSIKVNSSSENYVASVQVNIFNCGGIGLCTSLTHKIIDGQSYFAFMKSWAAAARGFSETISPSFIASEVFPSNPSLRYWFPSNLMPTKSTVTKRFVFDSKALASLKTHPVSCNHKLPSHSATRNEAITALVWKAASKAASTVKPFSPQSPHALLSFVNLRNKVSSPNLPNESIGNLIMKAIGICFPNKQPDLSTLMGEIRESIAKISSDHVESLKGEKGHEALNDNLKVIDSRLNAMGEGDCLFATSIMNSGIYDLDFGWGRPIWLYHMNPGSPGVVSLNDVLKGGGVEAVVSLTCEEMEIFERDPDILLYSILNPSPHQFL